MSHRPRAKARWPVTAEEVAKHLRLHPVTVRSLLAKGRIPGVKFGRAWRIDPAAIDVMIAGRAPRERRTK